MQEEDQYQHPEGDEGLKVLESMNEHHKELSAWALSLLPDVFSPNRVLDIGCGGGNALRVMSLKWPNSVCDGIDISEKSIETVLLKNKTLADAGKIRAKVASVSDIPFSDGEFDLITAIETYFFWPNLPNDLKSAQSKLRSGGLMLIVSEQFFDGKNDAELQEKCEKYHMKLVSNEDMVRLLEDAGTDVKMFVDSNRNWVSFVCKKK